MLDREREKEGVQERQEGETVLAIHDRSRSQVRTHEDAFLWQEGGNIPIDLESGIILIEAQKPQGGTCR